MTDRPEPSSTTTLLAIHQGAIGDFLLTLSVIESVRKGLGLEHLEVIADASSARLAATEGAIDACHDTCAVGLYTLFDADEALHPRLAALLAGADCVVSFLSGPGHGLHRQLIAATDSPVVSADPRPTAETLQSRRHITSQWYEALGQQGLSLQEPEPIRLRRRERGQGVVIHPGSGGMTKCWPVERFCRLADAINGPVTWMLGPAELRNDNRFTAVEARATAGRDRLVTPADLATAADTISSTALYIGNDAGMTHLAAALGVSTVAIFGPTDPHVWRPLGEHVHTIAPPQPTAMTEITPGQVLDIVRGLMREP